MTETDAPRWARVWVTAARALGFAVVAVAAVGFALLTLYTLSLHAGALVLDGAMASERLVDSPFGADAPRRVAHGVALFAAMGAVVGVHLYACHLTGVDL